MIIRDVEGQVIGSLRALRILIANDRLEESYAVMVGTKSCQEMGIRSFILKGVALQVVNNLSKEISNWSQAGMLIEDTKTLLNSFATWSVNHRRREANKSAHNLARDALSLHEDILEMEDIYLCIQSVVFFEML